MPLAGLVFGWGAFHDDWNARGQLAEALGRRLLALGLPLLVLAGRRLRPQARRRLAPFVVALALADLAWVHAGINPALPANEVYARTPAIDFLAAQPERMAATGYDFRPNAAMVYGLFDVRGDDSLKLSRYERVYGHELATPHPTFFRPIEQWDSPWLDRLGVRWVLAPPGSTPLVAGWHTAYAGSDATVFDRGLPQPLVRVENGAPSPPVVGAHPRALGARLAGDSDGLDTPDHRRDLGRRLARDDRWPPARRRGGRRSLARRAARGLTWAPGGALPARGALLGSGGEPQGLVLLLVRRRQARRRRRVRDGAPASELDDGGRTRQGETDAVAAEG